MRTNIDLDDHLVEEAKGISGLKTKKAVVEKSPSQEVWEHIQAHYTPQPGPVDLTFLSKKSPSLRWGMNCSCNFSYF